MTRQIRSAPPSISGRTVAPTTVSPPSTGSRSFGRPILRDAPAAGTTATGIGSILGSSRVTPQLRRRIGHAIGLPAEPLTVSLCVCTRRPICYACSKKTHERNEMRSDASTQTGRSPTP